MTVFNEAVVVTNEIRSSVGESEVIVVLNSVGEPEVSVVKFSTFYVAVASNTR
jgi:hypothetical protein